MQKKPIVSHLQFAFRLGYLKQCMYFYQSLLRLNHIVSLALLSIPHEDWEGVRNLVSALPKSLKRVVLVSSVGVTKFNELPWRLDLFLPCPRLSSLLSLLNQLNLNQSPIGVLFLFAVL